MRTRIVMLGITAMIIAGGVSAESKLYNNTFSLGDVKLLDGPYKHAMEKNVEYLEEYKVERLLYPFRKEAGLPTGSARNYRNWEGLAGHIGGHYLSALSMQYAATGDEECKTRLDYMIDELKKCQDAFGADADFVGYLSGIVDSKALWRDYSRGDFKRYTDGSWSVPWYNIHKMYAGLRDAWVHAGNETAKTMFIKLCDWGIQIHAGLSDNQLQSAFAIGIREQGGINEVYADAYALTNDEKYLNFAKRFCHKWLLDPMAEGRDMLDDTHANAQAAKVVGFQRIGEEGNDDYYHNAAKYFWETVTGKRSIAIGGFSINEWFRRDWKEFLEGRHGVETCNTYNMLKITEGLFRQDPKAEYADYYERALFNHILSTQHPEHGGYVYFTPVHPQHYRVYSAPDVAMWCCVGSGMENHTKYGEFIYTHTDDALYVNLFVASELTWEGKGVTVRQETSFPDEGMSTLTVSTNEPTQLKMRIRHPYWVAKGSMVVFAGGDTIGLESEPTSYIEVDRTWEDGGIVSIVMTMNFDSERLGHGYNDWIAIKKGPIVMGAKTGTDDLSGLIAGDARMGHEAGGTLYDPYRAPKLDIDGPTFGEQFIPVDGEPMKYTAPGIFANNADAGLVLEPFYKIHDARYMMYWNATIGGEIVGARVLPEKKQQPAPGIRQMRGKAMFSFATVDPSRRVVVYNLSGRQVADIAASSKTMELRYGKEGIGLNNGMYAVEIRSEGQRISEKLCVSK